MHEPLERGRLPGRLMENDAQNPCFGCGPANPDGLHLAFRDDGEAVRASFTPDERFSGWPGVMNAGFTFLAMMEACAWAMWARLGPALPASDVTASMTGPIALGKPVVVEARMISSGGDARFEMQALQEGKPAAKAQMWARRASPEEARKMAPRVPASLRAAWDERAAEPS